MDDLGFCSQCGKVLELKFRYCPFCGSQQKTSGSWVDLLDECLAPLEAQERAILLDRILSLCSQIDTLDYEIQSFLQGKTPQAVR